MPWSGVSEFALNRHLDHGYFAKAATFVIQNGNPAIVSQSAPQRSESERLRVGYLAGWRPRRALR